MARCAWWSQQPMARQGYRWHQRVCADSMGVSGGRKGEQDATTASVTSMWEVGPSTLLCILIRFYDLSASSHTRGWERALYYILRTQLIKRVKNTERNITKLRIKSCFSWVTVCFNTKWNKDNACETYWTSWLLPHWEECQAPSIRWFTLIDFWVDQSGDAYAPGRRHGDL
jgi:hypothetical protein